MSRSEEAYLAYIQQTIAMVEGWTARGHDEFIEDTALQFAIVHGLETIGEAASRLSSTIRARHPEVPWKEVRGFRNVAAHGYIDLEMGRVWSIAATTELTSIKSAP